MTPPGPLELSGRWEGFRLREGDTTAEAVYQLGKLTLPMEEPWTVPLVLIDEGNGRCRARLGRSEMLGIYRRRGDRLELCLRGAERGYPVRLVDEERQDVLILRRVP
jgi:hypothetical protein